jgi:hypothetical protein
MKFNFNFLMIIVIIIILIAVGIGLSYSGDNGGGNGGNGGSKGGERWEDLNSFKALIYQNYTVLEKRDSSTAVLDQIEDPTDSVWIIIGVESEFTSEEASAIRNFVESGGDLILASESTHANKISGQFGIEFINHRVLETELFDGSEFFIQTDAEIEGSSYKILMNAPLGLSYDENVTTVDYLLTAESSEWAGKDMFSFMDKNDNSEADLADVMGPIPLILEARFPADSEIQGKMFYIGDTGLFTDDLWARDTNKADYQNNEFVQNLLKYTISRQGTVIYDFSKHETYTSGNIWYPT